jgi:hypothetical protein
MIKNISNEDVVLRWDGRMKVLKPNEQFDVRDFNVPQDQVFLVENKVGSKRSGLVEIVHTKAEMMSLKDIRIQQEAIEKKEKELAEREAKLEEAEAQAKESKKSKK